MPNAQARTARWRLTLFITWSVIGILGLLYVVFMALGRVSSALAPFVIASLFVFALQSPVSYLERRGLPRAWATVWWFVIVIVFIAAAIVFIAPPVGRQLVEFATAAEGFVHQGEEMFANAQTRLSDNPELRDWVTSAARSVSASLQGILAGVARNVAQGILSFGSGFANVVFNTFIAMVIAFWLLKDMPKIREELTVLVGAKYEDDLERLLSTISRMVGGYLKGQTVSSLVTATIAGIGFAVIGVPYVLVLALITFIFNYVPYVGAFVSGVIAAAVGLFVSPLTALLAIIVSVVAQNLTDTLVSPRVMSKQVDLHPTLVIFSLLVGGTLFGFWGMIFAIPMAATAKALFVYYWERRTSRQLATEDGALFRTSTTEDNACEQVDEEEPDGESCE